MVLLGDIFELLRSTYWLETDVRPWSDDDVVVRHATADVLKKILVANSAFLDGLNRLCDEFNVDLTFIPGNHDALLNDPACADVRALLRGRIPRLGAGGAPFDWLLVDTTHGVFAEHGHEFDTFNRRRDGTRFVPGDAIVVELITRLPHLLLSQAQDAAQREALDADIWFVHELDNVRPQGAAGLLKWLDVNLSPENDQSAQRRTAVIEALKLCIVALTRVLTEHGEHGLAAQKFIDALSLVIRKSSLAGLKTLSRLEPPAGSEIAAARERAGGVAQTCQGDFDLVVSGHTHWPLHRPFPLPGGQLVTYLNTGTWRRIHVPYQWPDGTVTFRRYDESTIVCVHERTETRARGRYTFLRGVSGY